MGRGICYRHLGYFRMGCLETEFSRSPTQVHSLKDLLPQRLTCRMLAAGGLHSSHSVAGGPSLENCSIYLGVANYHYVIHIY